MAVFCRICGAPITSEPPSGPCPRCGSMARDDNIEVPTGNFSVSTESPTVFVTPYAETLLAKAQELITQGEFSIAVVVAHMACEIRVESALSRAFEEKNIVYLKEPVLQFLSGSALAFSNAVTPALARFTTRARFAPDASAMASSINRISCSLPAYIAARPLQKTPMRSLKKRRAALSGK